MRKYHNIPTEIDGEKFASKKEGQRYADLKILERIGEISNLTCHPKYEFVHNGIKIGTYTADFRYLNDDKKEIVEDVKGFRTQLFIWKKRMMLAYFSIIVQEV